MINKKLQGLAFCSVAALLTAGQASAHTGVKDLAVAGAKSYNAFIITHGCSDYAVKTSAQQWPVLGQAAVFPYGATAVWREVNNNIISDPSTIVSGVYNMAVSGLAGAASPFPTNTEIVDGSGNVHGLVWKDGALDPKMNAAVPFLITHPAIIDACISSVKVRVGVINFCDTQVNMATDATKSYPAPKDAFGRPVYKTSVNSGIQTNVTPTTPKFVAIPGGNGDHNRFDLWFKDLVGGSINFNDPAITGEAGLWSAGITVSNPNVATGSAVAACPGSATRQVTVEPSGADFDAYFTAPNLQPFIKTGTLSNF